MIFSTGLKKIYESIRKADHGVQNTLMEELQNKIASNSALAHKFELLEAISSNRNSLDKEQAMKFFKQLSQKHLNFLKENNTVALFYKEEKKLFEYFNINQKEVISDKLDLIVNKKDNQLNESIILDYVTNGNLITNKEYFDKRKSSIRESFMNIKREKSVDALDSQIRRIEIMSGFIGGKNKELVESSVKVIKREAFTNPESAVNKAYKLRILSEKLLLEFDAEDRLDFYDSTGKKNSSDKEFNAIEQDRSGKTLELPDIGSIKDISARVPYKKDSNVITLDFKVIVYPKAATMSDLMVESRKLNNLFDRLKNSFVNKCIYQEKLRLIDPTGIHWFTDCSKNNNPQSPSDVLGKQVAAQGFYAFAINVSVIMQAARLAQFDAYQQEIEIMLNAFNDYLHRVDSLSDIMTPDLQKENIEKTPKGRAKSYGTRDGADKYYTDKRQQGLGDKWTDDIFTGSVEDSEVGKGGKEEDLFDTGSNEFDDDEIDKMATRKAMGKK